MTEFVVAECERCGAKWLIETDEWRGLREWMMESDVGWVLVWDPCEDCQITDTNPGKTLMFRMATETERRQARSCAARAAEGDRKRWYPGSGE